MSWVGPTTIQMQIWRRVDRLSGANKNADTEHNADEAFSESDRANNDTDTNLDASGLGGANKNVHTEHNTGESSGK